ncbi:MAG: hypothetical protein ACOCWI_02235, partial [Bacillota bacterium]
LGNIEKIMVLPSRLSMSFLSSALSPNGIIVMSKTEENILVFEIDINLNQSNTTSLPLAESGRIFPAAGGTLLLTEGNQNIVYRLDDSLKTGFLPVGEIVEIYDFYNYIMIFINTNNAYRILRLSSNLTVMQNTLISGANILSVMPLNEGEQKFAIVEKNSEGATLYKYDMTFNKQTADNAGLGTIDNIDMFSHNDEILAVITGDFNAIYAFNDELECQLSSLFTAQSVNELFHSWLYEDGLKLLAKTSEGLVVIDYRFDKSYTTYIINDSCNVAGFIKRPNNNIIVFYDVTGEYEYLQIEIKAL